jgi:hypothetical protein
MATPTLVKISELTNLDAVPDDTDEFPMNDASTTKANPAGYMRRATIREVTDSGAQSGAGVSRLHLALNHASAINYTITGAPIAGDELTIYIETTAAHTVILSGSVTFDGTNQTATFSTAGESMILRARSATRWDILYNNGASLS